MIPFTEFDGRALGIDIEVVSSTKYVSGGATSLGGVVIDYGHFPQFTERITHEALFNLGAYMTPQVAHLQTLGLETLEVRYRRQAATALALAQWFETRPEVLRVTYAGLPSHPAHALFARQYGGTFGAMLTLDFADRDAAFRFLDALRLVHRATNLFDNRTLAIHPASTIFGLFDAEARAAMDVRDTTVRLSIGLEDFDDLREDFAQALAAAARTAH